MADQSQHVVQIPQAVNIAASQDSSISPELRQEAIGYLAKVKELSEETWKVRISILSVIRFLGAKLTFDTGMSDALSARSRGQCQ